jgi:hypothetical protein
MDIGYTEIQYTKELKQQAVPSATLVCFAASKNNEFNDGAADARPTEIVS